MEVGLENSFIDQSLKQMQTKHFLGVFPLDKIPFRQIENNRKGKIVMIVNLDCSHQKGSHFVTLIFGHNKTMIYNDSFNIPLEWRNALYSTLSENLPDYSVILKNSKAVQDQNSSFCGFFSMHKAMREDSSFARVPVTPFSRTKKNQNDKIVVNNILKMITHR